MPRSRPRRNRKPYQPGKAPPMLAAKQEHDRKNAARKMGLAMFGGQYGADLSDEMTSGPGEIIYLNRKSRRYQEKMGRAS